MRAAESLRADILAEFFSRYAGSDWFLKAAINLEGAAFSKGFTPVPSLDSQCQSVIGVILDYLQIDRKVLFVVT